MGLDITKIDTKTFLQKAKAMEDKQRDIVRTDPWVYIELLNGRDGYTKLKLEFSYGAVCDLYRDTGKNLQAGEINRDDLANMEFLAQMLFHGLTTWQPDVTLEKVQRMMAMKHRMYYVHTIGKAIEATNVGTEDMLELAAMVEQAQSQEGEVAAELPLPEIVRSPLSGQLAE